MNTGGKDYQVLFQRLTTIPLFTSHQDSAWWPLRWCHPWFPVLFHLPQLYFTYFYIKFICFIQIGGAIYFLVDLDWQSIILYLYMRISCRILHFIKYTHTVLYKKGWCGKTIYKLFIKTAFKLMFISLNYILWTFYMSIFFILLNSRMIFHRCSGINLI